MPPNVGKAKASVPVYDDVVVNGDDVTAEVTGLLERLPIDANNLQVEAEQHAALFARIALLAEEAASEARFAKKRLDIKKANLDGDIRKDAAAEGGRKPTEGQIENMIVSDPEIIEATDELLDAERAAGILGVLRQTMTHRREMLVELMRDMRHESSSYSGGC